MRRVLFSRAGSGTGPHGVRCAARSANSPAGLPAARTLLRRPGYTGGLARLPRAPQKGTAYRYEGSNLYYQEGPGGLRDAYARGRGSIHLAELGARARVGFEEWDLLWLCDVVKSWERDELAAPRWRRRGPRTTTVTTEGPVGRASDYLTGFVQGA